jgi:thiol-disulfide isomerase/thioredoxin
MSTIAITAVLDAGVSEAELTKYFKKFIVKNPAVKVVGTEIIDKKIMKDEDGWEVYLTNMKLEVQAEDQKDQKEISIAQTVFVKGDLMTPVLMNLKKNKNYANEFKPSINKDFYDKEHLLFGNPSAKHKIVVFSDPQCPYCMEIVPEMMEAAKENPDTFALYYYHLPLLRIHPVSEILTRVMHVAQHKGQNDIVHKLYSLKIDAIETNTDKVIAAVKKHSGFVVTKAEIDKQEVRDAVKADEDVAIKMMVTGTPTIYFDGEWDKMRNKFKSFMP